MTFGLWRAKVLG